MSNATKPNVIEGLDFRRGLVTSLADAAQPDDSLRDVNNLLPQRGSTVLKTRRGFSRVAFTGLPATHRITQIFAFSPDAFSGRLLAVLTNGGAAANNVQIWELNLTTLVGTRIDTAGRTWTDPVALHWGLMVGKKWYGGTAGEPMYSYNPTTTTWDPDAAASTDYKTWVSGTNDTPTLATEWPGDYAWKGDEKVSYSSKAFRPGAIRYDAWDTDVGRYEIGNRVSRKATWVATNSYWKSFRCIKSHVPNAANRPGDGTGSWQTYWRKVRFGSPLDDDSELRPNWKRRHVDITSAAKHGTAIWHAERMWGRYDGEPQRVQFSAALKFSPNKSKDIANVVWDPTEWGLSLDNDGSGGGWVNFFDQDRHGKIRALKSFGQYLMAFKRQALWLLSGESEQTFTRRQLSHNEGTFNQFSVTEHEGLLYFADEDGLKVTDGTQVQPVPGMENILDFWKARVSSVLQGETQGTSAIRVHSYGGYIWIAMSYYSGGANILTLVYDPPTASFWKTNLPARSFATTNREDRALHMYFVPGTNGANSLYGDGNIVFEYEAADTDDTGVAAQATTPVTWDLTTAWWGFGSLHQERRIRRMWAIVKGAMVYTIDTFRDWSTTSVKTTTRTVTQAETEHIEGEWIADSHAISYKVAGPSAPAEFHSLTVDTEPRRARHHRGG